MQNNWLEPGSAIHAQNRRAWDAMVRQGHRLARPAREEDFCDPLSTVDPVGWLEGGIRGKDLLCLAAGGGRHAPLYAAAGARVTVLDLSLDMLDLDRQVASARSIPLSTVQGSMTDLGMFNEHQFDVVIQPVSTCYVPDCAAVYRQVARVTRPGGLYISQHKSPVSLQVEARPSAEGYRVVLPYEQTAPLPEVRDSLHREPGTLEFLHRWEELVGGMCRAGFVIEDLLEPKHAKADAAPGTFAHRSRYVAPYIRIKARRRESAAHAGIGKSNLH